MITTPPSTTSDLVSKLRTDTEAICLPNGRKVGSAGHEKASDYLANRLNEIGCVPHAGDSFKLPYEYGGTSFCNIVGVVRGRKPRLAPLLVGAHYDSVIAAPCADDNAAAVAIALAAGEHAVATGALERDLIIAIFDAEEPPYFLGQAMGSVRFWHDQRGDRPIHAAIIMDLVGHDVSIHGSMLGMIPGIGGILAKLPFLADRDISLPFLHPLLFITGTESHPELAEALDETGPLGGLKLVPTLNSYIGDMSDHGVFRQHGVPYFFLSCGHWAHYHQPTDTPDRLNYRKMAGITRQVNALLRSLDGKPLHRPGQQERICDTLEIEIRHLRQSFGPFLPLFLKRAGLTDVTTRKHVDRVVESLLSLGL
jgi:hypothetical protein